MKRLFRNIRDIAVSGFLALLPLYVLFIIVAKAWKSLSSLGAGIAGIFGMKSILGLGGSTLFSGLLVLVLWIVIGLLVRFTFMGGVSRSVEKHLSQYLPGYSSYKEMAEEKLQHKVRILHHTSAFIKWQEYWRPAFIVEQDSSGHCVVFIPDVPETNKGHVVLAKEDQVRIVPSLTAIDLDASLKKLGQGLCNEYARLIPRDVW